MAAYACNPSPGETVGSLGFADWPVSLACLDSSRPLRDLPKNETEGYFVASTCTCTHVHSHTNLHCQSNAGV